MIAMALAKHLSDTVDGLTFDEDGTTGNVFVEQEPSTPDVAVIVRGYGGAPQPTLAPTDLPLVQIRVRGAAGDVRTGYELARAIYGDLVGMDGVTLDADGPDEVYVIGCSPVQSEPFPLGEDDNQRPEWVINLSLRVHAPTTHRH